jgi:small subunit ribosomal protein S9
MAVQQTCATGRRKTAIATVSLRPGKGRVFINGRSIKDYFGGRATLEMMVFQPLALT